MKRTKPFCAFDSDMSEMSIRSNIYIAFEMKFMEIDRDRDSHISILLFFYYNTKTTAYCFGVYCVFALTIARFLLCVAQTKRFKFNIFSNAYCLLSYSYEYSNNKSSQEIIIFFIIERFLGVFLRVLVFVYVMCINGYQ